MIPQVPSFVIHMALEVEQNCKIMHSESHLKAPDFNQRIPFNCKYRFYGIATELIPQWHLFDALYKIMHGNGSHYTVA